MHRASVLLALIALTGTSMQAQSPCDSSGALTLSRPGRNWQFLDAVGPHAGLLGREDGTFEAWIYPLKLFRDFQLKFRVGDIVLASLRFGHVVLMIQPPRGFGENPVAIYHDPDLPPSHHYLAAYRWLEHEFGADAVIHLGKHGTLEWLPGKGVGLSAETVGPGSGDAGKIPHVGHEILRAHDVRNRYADGLADRFRV